MDTETMKQLVRGILEKTKYYRRDGSITYRDLLNGEEVENDKSGYHLGDFEDFTPASVKNSELHLRCYISLQHTDLSDLIEELSLIKEYLDNLEEQDYEILKAGFNPNRFDSFGLSFEVILKKPESFSNYFSTIKDIHEADLVDYVVYIVKTGLNPDVDLEDLDYIHRISIETIIAILNATVAKSEFSGYFTAGEFSKVNHRTITGAGLTGDTTNIPKTLLWTNPELQKSNYSIQDAYREVLNGLYYYTCLVEAGANIKPGND